MDQDRCLYMLRLGQEFSPMFYGAPKEVEKYLEPNEQHFLSFPEVIKGANKTAVIGRLDLACGSLVENPYTRPVHQAYLKFLDHCTVHNLAGLCIIYLANACSKSCTFFELQKCMKNQQKCKTNFIHVGFCHVLQPGHFMIALSQSLTF